MCWAPTKASQDLLTMCFGCVAIVMIGRDAFAVKEPCEISCLVNGVAKCQDLPWHRQVLNKFHQTGPWITCSENWHHHTIVADNASLNGRTEAKLKVGFVSQQGCTEEDPFLGIQPQHLHRMNTIDSFIPWSIPWAGFVVMSFIQNLQFEGQILQLPGRIPHTHEQLRWQVRRVSRAHAGDSKWQRLFQQIGQLLHQIQLWDDDACLPCAQASQQVCHDQALPSASGHFNKEVLLGGGFYPFAKLVQICTIMHNIIWQFSHIAKQDSEL